MTSLAASLRRLNSDAMKRLSIYFFVFIRAISDSHSLSSDRRDYLLSGINSRKSSWADLATLLLPLLAPSFFYETPQGFISRKKGSEKKEGQC